MIQKYLYKIYHNLLYILLVCMFTGCIPENIELPTIVEAVDLGLSVKWASCNVGAAFPEDYGDYFAWGETEEKSDYSTSNSVTYNKSDSELKSRGIIDSNGNLTAAYDAATANWEGDWRMPTLDEVQELLNDCTWKWTKLNGVNGCKVTGPNGNSIFLPATGDRRDASLDRAGSYGYYWFATLYSEVNTHTRNLTFYDGGNGLYGGTRYGGRVVRPVYGKPKVSTYVTTGNATDITDSGATLSGTIDNTDKSVTCGIIYGTSSTLSSTSGTMKSTTSSGEFSVSVTSLSANTTYYYRAYAVVDKEYKYGEVRSFMTASVTSGDAIDLGLSVKWASCNVGAEAPFVYGNYFAWGETSPKSRYNESNSVTYGLSNSELVPRGIIGADGNLTAAYDAATVNLGDDWRMPTLDEIKELVNKCTWAWGAMSGVNGYKITGPSGNSIFLPAAGGRSNNTSFYEGSRGYYCSATPYVTSDNAYILNFTSDNYGWYGHDRRSGYTVRPVYDDSRLSISVTTGDATDITDYGVTLSGTVGNSDESVTCGIIYDTYFTLSSFTSGTMESTSSSGEFSVNVTGLSANTTYYYCAYVVAGGEYTYGEVRSFKTASTTVTSGDVIDLGLSVKWASCNVGATNPEDNGYYFAWGETSPKSSYNESNSVTYGLSISELESRGIIGSDGNLTAAYDAATVKLGVNWRMPTVDEMSELIYNCSWIWTTMNGVAGCKVIGPNGNSIFLPRAGCLCDKKHQDEGIYGYYWSATQSSTSNDSYCLYFNWEINNYIDNYRDYGLSVRPIYDDSRPSVSVTTGDATDITDCGATLSGIVGNSDKSVACGIIYGTSSTLSSTNGTLVSTTSSGEFSIDVTGFSPNTTYYYCAYVVVEGEYTYGEVRSFTTYSFATVTSGDAIDLGLSVKWASCNVGAESPEVYGNYFAWGETEPKSSYGESNSITHGMSLSELESRGFIDANGNLSAAYDAAAVNWGGNWRMPTLDEIQELIDDCVWEWSWMYGINGYKVTGPNGNSIFFPTAGFRSGMSLYDVGIICSYWSAMPCINGDFSYVLYFNSGSYAQSYDARCRGFTVRPVYDSKENNSDVDLDGYPKDEDWEVRRRK